VTGEPHSGGGAPTGGWTPTAPQSSGAKSSSANVATTRAASSLAGTSATPNVAAATPGSGSSAAGAGLGAQSFYGLESFALSDHLSAQVNLSNGNLVVHAAHSALSAPGVSVNIDSFYNSLSTGSGAFGPKTVLTTGRDVGLQVGTSSATFTGPSGFTAVVNVRGRVHGCLMFPALWCAGKSGKSNSRLRQRSDADPLEGRISRFGWCSPTVQRAPRAVKGALLYARSGSVVTSASGSSGWWVAQMSSRRSGGWSSCQEKLKPAPVKIAQVA